MKKNQILIILTATFFLGVSGTDIYIASLPKMVRDFGTTPNIVNFTISIYNIGIAAGVLFASVLSNRYGRRTMILIATGMFSVSAFLISISPSIWLIIALRIPQAFGCAIIIIVSRILLKDIMDQNEQMRANGIILSGLVISPAIAPVIGAYLSYHFGWKSCFVFSGLAGAILTTIAYRILPETNLTPITRLPRIHRYVLEHFVLLKDKLLLGVTIVYASAVSSFFAFIGISSYLYINKLEVSPIVYSYVFLLVAVAYLLGNQYMLALNRAKLSYERIIGIGTYSCLIGVAILASAIFFKAHYLTAIVISAGVLFMRVANAIINPTSQVLIINHFGKQGGNALGLLMCLNFCFQGIAVFLVTLFHENPLAGLVIISCAFSIISALAFLLTRKGIRQVSMN